MYNQTMKHISIILVHYNNEAQTINCLESLQDIRRDGLDYKVLVIDNGSQQKFLLPSKLENKRFEIIRSETNLGFSGGNNLGIQYAVENYNSDYLVLLNNDTIVDRNFLYHLYKAYQTQDNVGILCPLIYFKAGNEYHNSYAKKDRGNVIWFGGGSIDWNHLSAFHRGVDELDKGQFATIQDMDFATGCCMFIDREVLEKVGGFDERYFLYLEDVDLSLRIRENGYSLLLCPESKIWHENAGASGGPGLPTQDYYLTRNRLLFSFLHGNTKQKLIALRLGMQYLIKGSIYQKRALWHILTLQLGKQPLA